MQKRSEDATNQKSGGQLTDQRENHEPFRCSQTNTLCGYVKARNIQEHRWLAGSFSCFDGLLDYWKAF